MKNPKLIEEVISEYGLLGIDTIPLKPNSKLPQSKAWQSKSINRQWLKASADSNIGIRCGGTAQIAVIDCDEDKASGTFENVRIYLAGLGYMPSDYPLIQSATGINRHIYVLFTGGLDGHYRQLAEPIGAGEFRYGSAAYVVAPPSVVDGKQYELIEGDFRQIPSLSLEEMLPLLGNKINNVQRKSGKLIPKRAITILEGEYNVKRI